MPDAGRISVAMCTFNGERFLPEQLASIAAQSRLPDELVVRDDGSTDRTLALLEEFRASAKFAGGKTADLQMLDEKIAHLEARLALHGAPLLRRYKAAFYEIRTGRYERFSLGWPSALRDLVPFLD